MLEITPRIINVDCCEAISLCVYFGVMPNPALINFFFSHLPTYTHIAPLAKKNYRGLIFEFFFSWFPTSNLDRYLKNVKVISRAYSTA